MIRGFLKVYSWVSACVYVCVGEGKVLVKEFIIEKYKS